MKVLNLLVITAPCVGGIVSTLERNEEHQMRGEAEIRMDAEMWALIAQLEALKTDRAMMDNSDDQYPDEAYLDLAKQMTVIAHRLRKGI